MKSVKDLKGKTVVVSSAKGSIAEYLLANVLQQNGLKYSDVKVQYLLPTDAQAAFSSGKIEVWATFGVYQAVGLQQGGRLLVDGADGRISGYGFIGASEKTLADTAKKAALGDFLKRLGTALKWTSTHQDAYADAIVEAQRRRRLRREDARLGRVQQGAADHARGEQDRPGRGRPDERHRRPRTERGRGEVRRHLRPQVTEARHLRQPSAFASQEFTMPVEFISAVHTDSGANGPAAARRTGFDPDYVRRYARALDDGGFDHTLVAYHSASPDALQLAQFVATHTERIRPILAHRPGVIFPTHAARALATLDRISDGRLSVHIISGGSDEEQHREGDYLDKTERYERSDEYIQILRKVWHGRRARLARGQVLQVRGLPLRRDAR